LLSQMNKESDYLSWNLLQVKMLPIFLRNDKRLIIY
jgi:hypothetical protein